MIFTHQGRATKNQISGTFNIASVQKSRNRSYCSRILRSTTLDRAVKKKYATRYYQLKGYSNRNPGILVVWGTRADSHSSLYEMLKIEKKAKEAG